MWDSDCSNLLSNAGLSSQQSRGSEKRSQAAADLADILVAFHKLDEIEKRPEIFCEAVDLVLLPPIVADYCTELGFVLLYDLPSQSITTAFGMTDLLSQVLLSNLVPGPGSLALLLSSVRIW